MELPPIEVPSGAPTPPADSRAGRGTGRPPSKFPWQFPGAGWCGPRVERRPVGRRIGASTIVVCALAFGWTAASATDLERFTAERCARLILLFDRIVVSRYDHRVLGVEPHELEEARALRLQAASDCAAGRIWFGVHAIEDALLGIHVLPDGLPSRERAAAG